MVATLTSWLLLALGLLLPLATSLAPLQAFDSGIERRSLLWQGAATLAAAVAGTGPTLLSPVSAASAADAVGGGLSTGVVPPTKSVLVLGANGGTGRKVVQGLVSDNKRPCIATTRSGKLDFAVSENANVKTMAVDVSDLESITRAASAFPDLGAVIFCASFSSGDSSAVDRDGVINAAKCCIEQKIPRLVIVSSGGVSRPDSAVYLFLNTVAKGIMEAKIQGEDAIRELYRDPKLIEQGIGYTVIRPGGLTTEEPVGAAALELNQGDTKSGRLSREDVASLCIKCLDSPFTFDTTFECYEAVTAKPLDSVGFSNILKSRDPTTFKSGRECRGETWDDLFRGLSRDFA